MVKSIEELVDETDLLATPWRRIWGRKEIIKIMGASQTEEAAEAEGEEMTEKMTIKTHPVPPPILIR